MMICASRLAAALRLTIAIAALATMTGRASAQLAASGTQIPPIGPGTAITTVGQAVEWAQSQKPPMELLVGTIATDSSDARLVAPNTPGSPPGRIRDAGGTVGVILQSPPLSFTIEELIGLVGAAVLIAAGLGWAVGNRRRSTG